MLRKFNYTGRQKIDRSCVSIRIKQVNGEPATFDAQFDLSEMELPGNAQIYVEAYYKGSYMRFPYGCVSDKVVPENRALTDIEGGGSAHFRLKVIDESTKHGLILAEADSISPLDHGQENAGRHSILPVHLHDGLGDQVWRVAFEDIEGKPVLELNSKFEYISQIAKTDEIFLSLVYPAVVQIVLQAVLRGPKYITDLNGPEDDWRYEWLRFASCLPGIADPPPLTENLEDSSVQEDQDEWIAGVVGAFCTRCKTLDGFSRLIDLKGLS